MEYFDYKVIETIKKEMNLTNEELGLIFDMKAQSVSNKLNRKSKWNIIDLYKLVEYFDDGSEISIKGMGRSSSGVEVGNGKGNNDQ